MTHKILVSCVFVVSAFFMLTSAFMAVTIRSFDFSIHDRYRVILPRHLLLVSVAFLVFAALLVWWKSRTSHKTNSGSEHA